MRETNEELGIIILEDNMMAASKLKEQQQYVYDIILDKVSTETAAAFFIDGQGGTSKTYLYRAILGAIRTKNYIALAIASSGVAAAILPSGWTAHLRFKLSIEIEDNVTCIISKHSSLAWLVKSTKKYYMGWSANDK